MVVVPEATGCTKSGEESVLMEVHHHLSQNARTKKKKQRCMLIFFSPLDKGNETNTNHDNR